MAQMIGQGKTAMIYAEDGYAVKRYNKDVDQTSIIYEKKILKQIIKHTNLFVPKVYDSSDDVLKMDLLDGVLLGDRMRKERYQFACEDLIDLQLAIHQYEDVPLENAHDVYAQIIKQATVDDEMKSIALRSLNCAERQTKLCHFDFHPLNILYHKKQYYVIDWMNAKNGNPLLDIARTYIILRNVALRFSQKYLTQVTKRLAIKKEDIYQVIPAMALIRLLVDQPMEDEAYLIDLITRYQ